MTMTLSQLRLEHLRLHRECTGHHNGVPRFQAFADHRAIADDFAGTDRNRFERAIDVAAKL